MSGLFGSQPIDQVATWVAAIVTIVVLGGLLGERRLFGWSQHLFAGLATGLIALLAITEVIVPRLVEPIAADPTAEPGRWVGLAIVGVAAAAPWLPRAAAAVPISLAVGAIAAFVLGGAVIGTLLPQAASAVAGADGAGATLASIGATAVTILVLLGFLHGTPRGRPLQLASSTGRWLMLAGLGGWLGYLLLSRLVLLVDRVTFLLQDWLGLVR